MLILKNWWLQINRFLNFFTIVFIMSTTEVFAQLQHWEYISGNDIPYFPKDLPYSENLGLTIHCAQFFHTFEEGGYLAGFNGEEWGVLSDSLSANIYTAVDFEQGILICGGGFVGTQQMAGVAYYDGNTWSYPWSFNDDVSNLVWANDTLYAIGTFTEIDGVSAYRVARLVNGAWEGVIEPGLFPNSSSILFDIEYYDGNYYLGGTYTTGDGVKNFARIENMNLVSVENGPSGANLDIRDMAVYKNELYLSGSIPYVQDNVGNHVVRYDSEEWKPVGEPLSIQPNTYPLNSTIRHTYVNDDYLYAVGTFEYAGNVPMHGVAKWDGEVWCGLNTNEFLEGTAPGQDEITEGGFFQDRFMIFITHFDDAGNPQPHWLHDGSTSANECSEPLSVGKSKPKQINLYPNPSSEQIHIQSENEIRSIQIINAFGQTVFGKETSGRVLKINLATIPPGLYFMRIETDKGLGIEKLVHE